jgi:hypothetical protein
VSAGQEGHWFILTTRDALGRQAVAALKDIVAANGGEEPARLRDAYDIAPEAFASLIEALVNLGADVDPELVQLAGLRPLDELL